MRLVDFLVLMLEAHAETLKRLAAFFGEEPFLEMLESSDADELAGKDGGERPAPELDLSRVPFSTMGNRLPAGARSAYVELEGAVRELGLPAVLEFHLWAYPHYRSFIESELDLSSTLGPQGAEEALAIQLIDRSVAEAKLWAQRLPIPPSLAAPAEAAAAVPWIKFRASAFRKIGLRPIGAIGPSGLGGPLGSGTPVP